MEKIIKPVNPELIELELKESQFIRNTNKGGNEIYIVIAKNAPHTMREIGRIREMCFRMNGGGSGKEIDTDEFDFMEKPYKQLIVWNPQEKEIIGGYRYIHGQDVELLPSGQPRIVTEHMFAFSPEFIKNYLPYTLDLGRAFIHPDYQSSRTNPKSIFAFDNLWDGLLTLNYFEPEIRYVIGKVTIYKDYDLEARNAIFYFLNHFLSSPKKLIVGKDLFFDENTIVSDEILNIFTPENIEDKYKNLVKYVRSKGVNVPPLISSYFKLSPTLKVYGTGINREFGDILDTGIMISVNEIAPEKLERHLTSFLKDLDKQSIKKMFL